MCLFFLDLAQVKPFRRSSPVKPSSHGKVRWERLVSCCQCRSWLLSSQECLAEKKVREMDVTTLDMEEVVEEIEKKPWSVELFWNVNHYVFVFFQRWGSWLGSEQFPVTSSMMKATAQRDEWNKIWQNTRKNDKIWRVLASLLQECFVLRLDTIWWFNDSQTPKTGAITFIGGSDVTLLQFVALVPTEWNADIHTSSHESWIRIYTDIWSCFFWIDVYFMNPAISCNLKPGE